MDKFSFFYIGQAAYLSLFLAFCFSRVQWFRGLAVLSSLVFIWFNYSVSSEPLWLPIVWNSLFIAANLFYLVRFKRAADQVKLDPLEEFLHKTALANFPPAELKSFVFIGNEGALPTEHCLIHDGTELQYLFCILQGGVRISKNKKTITELVPGCFVGEMSLLTKALTRADVFTTEPSRFLVWKHEDIDTWVEEDSARLSLLQAALGTQVVEQLLRQNEIMRASLEESA